MAGMTKHTVVLDCLGHGTVSSMYRYSEDHNETMTLPAPLLGQMGKPDKITVTVEPGDLLNDVDARIDRWIDLTGIIPCKWQRDMMRSILFDDDVTSVNLDEDGERLQFRNGDPR